MGCDSWFIKYYATVPVHFIRAKKLGTNDKPHLSHPKEMNAYLEEKDKFGEENSVLQES